MSKRPKFSSKLMTLSAALLLIVGGVSAWAFIRNAHSDVVLPGEVQAREIRTGSRFGGRICHIWVKEGEMVQQGQLLVEFEDSELKAKLVDAQATLDQALIRQRMLARGADLNAVNQANAAVNQAQANAQIVKTGARPEELAQIKSKVVLAETQYAQAHQAFQNAKSLLDSGIISQQKYDALEESSKSARSNLDAAQAAYRMAHTGGRAEERRIANAQLAAARAQAQQVAKGAGPDELGIAKANVDKARSALKSLEAQMEEVRIKAPFSGQVSVISVAEGELVSPGRSVVALIDYSHLWADVFMPESKLLKVGVSAGMPVEIVPRADKTRHFPGKVALVNPKSEFVPSGGGDSGSDESTFRVKVSVVRADQNGKRLLYPGMKVDVTFH